MISFLGINVKFEFKKDQIVMFPSSSTDENLSFDEATMHFIGRVTMLFANNSSMECLITMKRIRMKFYRVYYSLIRL